MLDHLLVAKAFGHCEALEVHKLEAFLHDLTGDKLLSENLQLFSVQLVSEPPLIVNFANEMPKGAKIHGLLNLIDFVEVAFNTVGVGDPIDDLLDESEAVLVLHFGEGVGDVPADPAELAPVGQHRMQHGHRIDHGLRRLVLLRDHLVVVPQELRHLVLQPARRLDGDLQALPRYGARELFARFHYHQEAELRFELRLVQLVQLEGVGEVGE